MSRYTDTPKELGEMEVKEAVLQALNKDSQIWFAKVHYAFESSSQFIDSNFHGEAYMLIRKIVRNNDCENKKLAVKIANELISCNYITQDTLEELGQKQLNEAY